MDVQIIMDVVLQIIYMRERIKIVDAARIKAGFFWTPTLRSRSS